MKRRCLWLLFPLLILAMSISGCGQKTEEVTEPDPVPVRVASVAAGSISEQISFSGEVASGTEVQVVPKMAGRIARVAVQVGQGVRKGELILQLEADELSVMLKQAEAALEMARANHKNAKSGSALSQLKSAAQQAEANYSTVKANLDRMEYLFGEGAISQQQLDGVRLQYQVAESQYNLAKEQLALFERGEGQLEILAAQVKQAEAGVEMARLNYNNSRITAPVDGTVSMINAEAGNMVSPGMAVATIVDAERMLVVARLTEQTVGLIAAGMPVRVEIPTLNGVFAGEVRDVAPGPITGTKSYLVKVKMLEGEGVKPGMFARLQIATATKDEAVLLPRQAVQERDGKLYAFTVENGRARRREVTVGLQDETFAEVTSGFAVGDTVVVSGQHFLRENSPVLVEEGDSR